MDVEWRDRAACKGKPTRWWFPEQGDTTEAGKAVCAQCPVAVECGDYAVAAKETTGMWAGHLLDVRKPKTRTRVRVKDRVLAELKAGHRSWVTVAQLSMRTGLGSDQVSRALRELAAEHPLEHDAQPGRIGYWRCAS